MATPPSKTEVAESIVDRALSHREGERLAALSVLAERASFPIEHLRIPYLSSIVDIARSAREFPSIVIAMYCEDRADWQQQAEAMFVNSVVDRLGEQPDTDLSSIARSLARDDPKLMWRLESAISRVRLNVKTWSLPQPGTILKERYRLTAPVRSGGGGTIWKSFDLMANHAVAIKTLRRPDSEQELQFLRECDFLRRCAHTNVVRYIDQGSDDSIGPFLVMEWIDGEAADAAVTRLGRIDRVLVFREFMRGLDAIHNQGVVHGDIKPANVLTGSDLIPRIVDFGAAAAFTEKGGSEGCGPGSERYMSPQRLRGLAAVPQDDIYASGVLMFEMLMGRPRKLDERLSLRSIDYNLSGRLEDIYDHMIAVERQDRYRSAAEIVDDLSRWVLSAWLRHESKCRLGTTYLPLTPEVRAGVAQRFLTRLLRGVKWAAIDALALVLLISYVADESSGVAAWMTVYHVRWALACLCAAGVVLQIAFATEALATRGARNRAERVNRKAPIAKHVGDEP